MKHPHRATQSIVPVFDDFPNEAAVIARLLAGYGEIEFDLCNCLGAVLGNDDTAIRTLFRLRSEDQRLHTADALMRPAFVKLNLTDQYNEALGAIRWCKSVRNQYAHCHWITRPGQLLFIDLDEGAKSAIGTIELRIKHVDAPLLAEQEAYFIYANDWLKFFHYELHKARGEMDEASIHYWTAPRIIPQPKQHNPPPTRTLQEILRAYAPHQ